MYKILLLTGCMIFLMTSCDTEYIPDYADKDITSAVAKEGNFTLNLNFANFGAPDSMLNMESNTDSLSTTRRMEPETNVYKVNDDMIIYTTLSEDPVENAPAVKTRAFNANSKIRVLAYAVTGSPTPTYTKAFDEEYTFNGGLSRTSGMSDIILPAGTYKFIAYSYNNAVTPISPLLNIDTIIPNIDPINDLIWGESVPTTVFDGPPLDTVYIKMVHKLSQVKLVAATPQDATPSTHPEINFGEKRIMTYLCKKKRNKQQIPYYELEHQSPAPRLGLQLCAKKIIGVICFIQAVILPSL